jgi:pentatricopeptide repeat protein
VLFAFLLLCPYNFNSTNNSCRRRYTYNTLINALAKSGERGAAARAEHVLQVMEKRFRDGDPEIKPNTRTHTSVIDAYAKSGERGAARRAEQILNGMISRYDATRDPDIKPNVHTANAVCNVSLNSRLMHVYRTNSHDCLYLQACAFSKKDEDRLEALQIAFRVFDWLSNQTDMEPDSYTYTILLSVCANLIPREDAMTRFAHARAFFDSCRDAGYVNDYVLRKLRQTVTDDEYLGLVEYRMEPTAASMPHSWTRNIKLDVRTKARRGGNSSGHAGHGADSWSSNRRGK